MNNNKLLIANLPLQCQVILVLVSVHFLISFALTFLVQQQQKLQEKIQNLKRQKELAAAAAAQQQGTPPPSPVHGETDEQTRKRAQSILKLQGTFFNFMVVFDYSPIQN